MPEINNRCGYVDDTTGKDLFIGTKVPNEWFSFRDNETISSADGCDDDGDSNTGT